MLRERGLAAALEAFATTAPVTVRRRARARPAAAAREAAVYFTALEAIQNAIKHAGPGAAVEVAIERAARRWRSGSPTTAPASTLHATAPGVGLISMEDRVSAAGGELEIGRRRAEGRPCAAGRAGSMGPMTIRVVVGEDSAIVREGIARMLERSDEIAVVATCGDAATLRAAIAEHGPDVVLTDIRMPPTLTDEGIRVAVELRRIGARGRSRRAQPARRAELRARAARGRHRTPWLSDQGPPARLHRGDPGDQGGCGRRRARRSRWWSTA